MIKKKSIQRFIAPMVNELTKLSEKKKIFIPAGIAAFAILCTSVFLSSGTEVYSLSIADENIGYITDTAVIEKAVNSLIADYADGNDPVKISVDRDQIDYMATDLKAKNVDALNVKELENKIAASVVCTADGWAINVNGKNVAAVSSEEDADQILNDLKKQYISKENSMISVDFKENVTVTKATVQAADLMTPEEAVPFLLTGQTVPKIYTVKDGDTLWDIAAANGISTEELINSNPGFNPDKLKIGQQLNLFTTNPFVTVSTKEIVKTTEKIAFQTVYQNSSSLYQGQVKIKSAGVPGTREVSSEVTKENGITVSEKVLSSVVAVPPTTQIALKGTKTAAKYIASRGSGRTVSLSASGSDIVAYAEKYLGVPYRHGGSTPDGFDCSGYTKYVMAHFGGNLPRTAAGQYGSGVRIEKSQLRAGDLVFFKPTASSGNISHVGIYIGGGQFIHSPQPGENVKISSLSSSYNRQHYYGAVRITN